MSLEVNITKKLDGFTLHANFAARSTATAILGASGCGKSMTLRCIAGIVKPDAGRIVLDGRVLFDSAQHIDLPPQQRGVGLLFQNYALFPNMTVEQNVLCGLKAEKDKAARKARCAEMLQAMRLESLAKRYPAQLSGGQQQRVAIARALVTSPEIICLDEPLSNLDAKLRVQLRNELKDLQRKFGITTVYVTHDQEEALTLSNRIAVFNKGVIEQIGRPDEIYNHSATEFVCNFIGDINHLDKSFLESVGAAKRPGVDLSRHCYIRLERVHVNDPVPEGWISCQGTVTGYEYYGLYIKYTVEAHGQTIKVIEKNSGKPLFETGSEVTLSFNPENIMQY